MKLFGVIKKHWKTKEFFQTVLKVGISIYSDVPSVPSNSV
jgi:hypothetical protein